MPLSGKIHFSGDAATEFFDQVDRLIEIPRGDVMLNEIRQPHEDIQVRFDDLGDAGTPHLNDDLGAIFQCRTVHLGD